MHVPEEVNQLVHQGQSQWAQDGARVGLYVLRSLPVDFILAAEVITRWCHDVWDEIIIPTTILKEKKKVL